jgi:hypothetical protein
MCKRTFTIPILFAFLLLQLLVAGVQRGAAQGTSSPAFSTLTPTSGEMKSSFVVFLPLANTGNGAATHVTVTSVTLGGIAQTSPTLPLSIGTLSGRDFSELHLQFDATRLTLGRNFLLTVRGIYDRPSSATKLGFTVNRFVNIATTTAARGNEMMKWLTLDAIKDQLHSLQGMDDVAKARAILAFVQGRPEIVASGIDSDFSSLWGQFADGEEFIICVDRHVDTPFPAAETSNLTATNAPAAQPQTVRKLSTLAVPQAVGPASPTELPAAAGVRLLNGLPGSGYGDSGVVADLSAWVLPQGYFLSGSPDASVNLLKGVGGDGVLYFASHGGFGNNEEYAVWTTTRASDYADQNTFALDVSGDSENPRTLRKMLADTEYDPAINDWKDDWHYAINANFVKKYWSAFSANSFVYIDACKSGAANASDFQQAILGKKASVYAGWNISVGDATSGNTTRLMFDRLLGANQFCPENGQACAPGKATSPVFAQRPFDYNSVFTTEFGAHNLGSGFIILSSSSGSTFGLMAPSISNMQVDETQGDGGQLTINGIFGKNQDTVQVGGFDAHVVSWDPTKIVVDLSLSGAGSAGDVQVTVRGHKSNVARLTEWSSDKYNYTINGDGSLQITAKFNLHFRADIRKYRPVIHAKPIEPNTATLGAADSGGTFSASGTGSGPDVTYLWTGSASIVGVTLNVPITGENLVASTWQFIDSKHANMSVGAAPEANAPEATCTEISPMSPPFTSTLELGGPSNLGPLIGDSGPRSFPITLNDDAVIGSGAFGAQGRGLFSAYFCMESTKTATYNFKWGPINPTSNTAPDPDSAR